MERTLGNGSNVSRSVGEVVALLGAAGETLIWTCAEGTGLAAWAWFPGRKGGELEGNGREGGEAVARSESMLVRFHGADGCSAPIWVSCVLHVASGLVLVAGGGERGRVGGLCVVRGDVEGEPVGPDLLGCTAFSVLVKEGGVPLLEGEWLSLGG